MKKALTIIPMIMVLISVPCFGQNSQTIDVTDYANDFSRPLHEVLADVADLFGVKINAGIIPDTLMVPFADFRIRQWDIEQTLEALLWPFGYNAEWNNGNGEPYYSVSTYRHSRRNPWEGKELLEYLGSKYDDQTSWESRKALLRSDMRHYSGLDRVAEHFDGKVLLSKKRNYGEYSVQNLALEILPGLYCYGAIYWPKKAAEGACPLVINPHGHNSDGHAAEVVQIRSAMQARMGCIAISYSMFCNGPSPQFPAAYHKTGLAQPYNLLCAERLLDYALKFKEVDPTRVGITGCSGGGSQTMFITAMDDRITLAVPVVMMSSYFAGGCECESGTRIPLSGGGTSNVEIASMCAPRPMLLISDGGDWTAMNPEIEVPFVKRIYGFYNADDKIEHVHFPLGQHNYDGDKRQEAYKFISSRWGLNTDKVTCDDGRFDESACVVEKISDMNIWKSLEKPSDMITDISRAAKVLYWEKNAE